MVAFLNKDNVNDAINAERLKNLGFILVDPSFIIDFVTKNQKKCPQLKSYTVSIKAVQPRSKARSSTRSKRLV